MDIHRKSLRRKSKNIKATSGNESHEQQQQEQQQQQHVVLLLCKLMLKDRLALSRGIENTAHLAV